MTNHYIEDSTWDALRDAITTRGMSDADAADPLAVDIARAGADEFLCAHGIYPLSIRDDVMPENYLAMDESVFEAPPA